MPSPQAAELRPHSSPVPTQMMLGFFWLIRTSPIETALYRSKIGVHVVPAFTDLNTPPDADPTMTWAKSDSSASTAEIRPIRLALPTLRHLRSRISGSDIVVPDWAASVAPATARADSAVRRSRRTNRADMGISRVVVEGRHDNIGPTDGKGQTTKRGVQGGVMTFRRFTVAILLAVSVVLTASSLRLAGLGRAEIPARLTDQQFWQLSEEMSEPSAPFNNTDNLLSNEIVFARAVPELVARTKPGGVYLGVGPEQNFTYIAAIKPKVVFITDIRRGNLHLHLMYKALFELSAD